MANETILIVDADTKSQKVLEVSFKKAGYRVVMTDAPTRARELAQDVSPDIIISDTQFPSGGTGFEFLGELKGGALKGVPFIFLTEERALPQKMKGFELGADDYLTKPIYIKEVTTRVELLLQKRAKEQLTEESVEEVEGSLADITMIDMLQSIEEELRSGTIHLTRESQSAVIYFREGNILDAICGKLQGEEAIYRLMLWPDGEFVLRYHEQVRRVDRVEKDSGALLLEGIRRLDEHNELLEQLPSLHRMYEANYEALSGVVDEIPDEVGRIVRLFDGMRTIREVTEGSPVDDLTTLQIIAKLLEDNFLVDVTPDAAARGERTTSNLSNWLAANAKAKGQSGPGAGLREDTSPKFGSSISEMVEKRSTAQTETPRDTMESAQPMGGREPQDTDPFGSRVEPRNKPARRKTLPLKDAYEEIDSWEDEELRDGRRKTALQWDRPRSGWNIHFDAAEDAGAAIREIEQEERRRREEEAKHISGVHREATLRFAPAQSRTPEDAGGDDDLIRRIEEDERRRQQEEARRLQAQRESMELEAVPSGRAPRRATDELPAQSRIPAIDVEDRVDTDELDVSEDVDDGRLRESTPRSSPAMQKSKDVSDDLGEGWEALAATSEPVLDAEVSEAEVFDDSDEHQRLDKARERVTLDIRPPTKLSHLSEESEPEYTAMDPGGLFDIGNEETSPGADELEEIEIEVIEVMPTVARQATDNELVRTEYDLSIRTTVTPAEIQGRPESVSDRVTMELRAPATRGPSLGSAESRFFADGSGEHDYDFEHGPSGLSGTWIALLVVAVGGVLIFMMFRPTDEPVPVPPDPVVKNVTKEPPPQTVAPIPTGLGEMEATMFASNYASSIAAGGTELTIVLSGADLMPDAGFVMAESDAGTEVAVVDPVEKPPIEKPPIEKPPIEKPPIEKPPVEKPPIERPPVEKPTVDKTPVSPSVKKAERLVKREKWESALKMLRPLSKADPKNQKVAYLHGLAAFSSNNNGEAIENFARAERLGYRTAALYLDLGAAYQLDGKKDRARWAYEKFLKKQPNGRQADEVRAMLSSF